MYESPAQSLNAELVGLNSARAGEATTIQFVHNSLMIPTKDALSIAKRIATMKTRLGHVTKINAVAAVVEAILRADLEQQDMLAVAAESVIASSRRRPR